MRKYLPIIIFALLIEYQIFIEPGHYSLVTIGGILLLGAYHLYKDTEGFKEFKTAKVKNKVASFSGPIISLYAVNFLLSNHIEKNLAYQFILILTCCVIFDAIYKGTIFTHKFENNQMSKREFKQFLSHRWSKYLNFFLWIWLIISFADNGVISDPYKYILIFIFAAAHMINTNRVVTNYEPWKLALIVGAAGVLTGTEPFLEQIANINLPHYIIAVLLFLFYDGVDQYFHYREFKESSLKLWEQKAVIYILITIFITQLHSIEENPFMDTDSIFSSILNTQEEVMEPTIHVEDVSNASTVRTN